MPGCRRRTDRSKAALIVAQTDCLTWIKTTSPAASDIARQGPLIPPVSHKTEQLSWRTRLLHQKQMTIGEGGLALTFAALALLCIVIAAKAYTPEYAFHAYLFAAASVAAVFAIVNRYFDRPAEPAPLTIDGKPNYNMGPVKFATVAAMFWGIAGFTVGLIVGAATRLPGAQLRSALDHLRPHAAAAHLGGDLRLRRQRADRDVVLCRAAHLPRAARRRPRALVRRARLQLLHRDRRHRLSARHHADRRNTPSRNGTPTSG